MPTIERDKIKDEIASMAQRYQNHRTGLLPILHELQARYGHISDVMMQEVADRLNLKPVEVYSTMSFYHFFNTQETGRYVIRLCQTISCDMLGKEHVARQFENELGIEFGETTPDGMFTLEYASCLGMCDQGPAVLVNDKVYTHVTPAKVHGIINECRKNQCDNRENMKGVKSNALKLGPILESAGSHQEGLKKALQMTRQELIEVMKESGLKGRGGAGFPTFLKWQLAAASKGDKKYVVCNADEGEPGTFKDRLLLTNYADLLFDGMTIAGYAIGSQHGILYLRAEYYYMKKHLEDVLNRRREKSLLGKNILGKDGFSFDIEIRMGAGAYVCGEETALIESIEGKRGEPRDRPPYPVVVGIDGYPTAVNNVETFVAAELIMANGAPWFKKQGTEKTTGTKLFSVSGDCERPGIYELPMGVTIRELLAEVGGEEAKAVQVGGASGTCVPASDFDRKITYEDVASGGSIIVFGPYRDMLEVAENFMEFFVEESCGQCFLCRKGNVRLLEGIERLQNGVVSMKELKELQELGKSMQVASKCGLGQTSANAFLSIVENFSDEILGRVPVK
jgi:[NiFe] hydrogenase diaphorase moiety large subunit